MTSRMDDAVGDRVVECADLPFVRSVGDDETRRRARFAPEEVRRHIDAGRRRRGLKPLWPDAEAARQAAASKARSLRAFLKARSMRPVAASR